MRKGSASLLWLWSGFFLLAASVPAAAQTGTGRNEYASELERFMPEGVEQLYHREDCKVAMSDPCTLWVAGERDARYMIFYPRAKNSWPALDRAALVRSVLPEDLTGARLARAPQFNADDPETWAVSGAEAWGHGQIIARPDEVMVVWMPGGKPDASFERVAVTLVTTPPPLVLKEISVPDQPDVIDQDSAGYLWFSGWMNEIYRIDPATDIPEPMTGHAATGTPDGLIVDSSDSVWYGGYNERYLGTLTAESPLVRYVLPYTGGNAAIPCEAPDGNIWVTDHPSNRLTEFDPVAGQWGRSVVIPGGPAWPVQCLKDPKGGALWITLYQNSSLGRLDLETATLDRYPLPCAPAFLAFDANGSLWTGCWSNGHVIQLDPASGAGIDYVIPNPVQVGGISIGPDGRVAFTQNSMGRVAVLDPKRLEVYTYQMPSRPTFKDGLLVDRTGTIWAPSPYGRVVGKIVPE